MPTIIVEADAGRTVEKKGDLLRRSLKPFVKILKLNLKLLLFTFTKGKRKIAGKLANWLSTNR